MQGERRDHCGDSPIHPSKAFPLVDHIRLASPDAVPPGADAQATAEPESGRARDFRNRDRKVDEDQRSKRCAARRAAADAGSLHYMSPEQLEGQPVDMRSDLFSVGVMAFEALMGRLPFSGTNY